MIARGRYFVALVFPAYVYLVAHVRPLVQTVWSNDTLIIVDSGARLLEGLVPHVDYFSPIGIVTPALVAAGLWFSNLDLTGAYGAVEWFAAGAAILIYLRALRLNLSWPLAALTGFLVLEFAVSLRPLGYSPQLVSLSGLYNRVGWVLLTGLFLEVLGGRRAGGWIVGILVSLLLGTKFNLFLAGGVLAAAGAVPRGRWAYLRRAALGFGITTAAWMIAGRVSPAGFARDTLTVLRAMPRDQKLAALTEVFRANAREFTGDILFALAFAAPAWRAGRRAEVRFGAALLVSALGAAVLAGVGSIAPREYLLSFVSPLVIFAFGPPRWWRVGAAFAMMAWLSAATLRANQEGYRFRGAQRELIQNVAIYQPIDSPRARDLYFLTWPNQVGVVAMRKIGIERVDEPSPAAFALQASAAIELVRDAPAGTLLTLMGDQTFAYLAGRRHVPGDWLFYHVGRVNTLDFPSDPGRVVEAADLVLTPKNLNVFTYYGGEFHVRGAYYRHVVSRFTVLRENEYWTLWSKP